MRLPRGRFILWKLLITVLIAADLFAIWVWAVRPPGIYSYWHGQGGFLRDAPIHRLVAWAAWEDGPRTPSGCWALFEAGELIFAGLTLFALIVLILFLFALRGTVGPQWRRLSAPVGALRFRVSTALAVLAIFGLYLGWEIHEWRTWQLRIDHLGEAAKSARGVDSTLSSIWSRREEIAKLAKINGPERADFSVRANSGYYHKSVYYHSKAARDADRLALKDRKKREVDLLSAKLAVHAERKHRYELAAANPRKPVAPDRSMPEREFEVEDWLRIRDYRRALAAYDELARTYPDLVEAHSQSAWLRATCPDAQYRDGKRAIASARRACELTNWQDPEELGVLAAAFAEAGDFASAVKWQQKALALSVRPADAQSCQERLDLYLAGKVYRQQ